MEQRNDRHMKAVKEQMAKLRGVQFKALGYPESQSPQHLLNEGMASFNKLVGLGVGPVVIAEALSAVKKQYLADERIN